MKKIEVCVNDEWYRVMGPLECGIDDDTDEATQEYQRVACRLLADDPRAADFDVDSAQGQRRLCHGWNGAHFTHQAGGIATFADLTPDEQQAIFDAHDKALDAANALVPID